MGAAEINRRLASSRRDSVGDAVAALRAWQHRRRPRNTELGITILHGLTVQNFMYRFDSLGENCEFGIVQLLIRKFKAILVGGEKILVFRSRSTTTLRRCVSAPRCAASDRRCSYGWPRRGTRMRSAASRRSPREY